jgi:hypothetical protein
MRLVTAVIMNSSTSNDSYRARKMGSVHAMIRVHRCLHFADGFNVYRTER